MVFRPYKLLEKYYPCSNTIKIYGVGYFVFYELFVLSSKRMKEYFGTLNLKKKSKYHK